MPAAALIAQTADAPGPILPHDTEPLWGVVWFVVPLIALVVAVGLMTRYFRRIRLSAEEAATRAGAAEREVAALRAELRKQSA